MWLATGAMQVQELAAAVQDGVLTMWQVHPERPDFRASFHVHDDDRWEGVQHARDDDGEWQPRFRLSAQRIPCD